MVLLFAWGLSAVVRAEDESIPKGGADEITFQFLPPPLEDARYSIGVYDAKRKLVRRLFEGALESSFPAALNGLIIGWNAKDDAGRRVPNGRYQLRGYAVGPLKITGVATLGNDWLADDPTLRVVRVKSITRASTNGVRALVHTSGGGREWILIQDGKVQPRSVNAPTTDPTLEARLNSFGWKVGDGRIYQESEDGRLLREWRPPTGEPVPVEVAAIDAGRIFVLEDLPGGRWERLRGLEIVEGTKPEWRVSFERNIRVPDKFEAADTGPTIRMDLVRNPLGPKRSGPPSITLQATFDGKGSYLGSTDGLRLRQVSQVKGIKAVAMAMGSGKGTIRFFQRDDAASEEFLIEGVDHIMAFEVGGCEVNERGEVLPEGEPPNPK